MITVALTGGIGAGKSTVTRILKNMGYIVIDADKMAREITSAGGKSIPYIKEHFGSEFILPDGSMDRAKMRDLIFNNPSKKEELEIGTTNVVIEDINSIKKEALNKGVKVVFFDIPLLFENNLQNDYDYVWTIYSDYEIRKQRIKDRDNVGDLIIDLIIGSQTDEEEKVKMSDEIIYNNSSIDNLENYIKLLLNKYNLI